MRTTSMVVGSMVLCAVGCSSAHHGEHVDGFRVPAGCDVVPVVAVSASGDDGNVAANAVDGKTGTRWSSFGKGSWIRLDLGQPVAVGALGIDWYHGSQRANRFRVALSDDGGAGVEVLQATSKKDPAMQSYALPATSGRYVTVTVDGNSDNDWASISELAVCRAAAPPASDAGVPGGVDAGAPGGSDAGAPPPAPAGYDPNGVKQLYPTRAGKAAPWVLGFGDWKSRATKFGAVSGSGKDTVVSAKGQVRMNVEAEPNDCDGDTDQGRALARGYMCTPNDWYDYEMTGYVKLDDAADSNGDQDFTFYGGGGRHTGDGPPDGCMGSAYKGSYHYIKAQVRFGKESWHVNYDYRPWKDVAGGIDLTKHSDRWIGIKLVKYEFTRDGKRGIRNELWLDLGGIDAAGNPANDWHLADVEEDHPEVGSWGEKAKQCGVPADDQIMFWGGPEVTYRWDNTAARLRLASVREIVPPAQPPTAR